MGSENSFPGAGILQLTRSAKNISGVLTNFGHIANRLASLINESEFEWVERDVVDLVSGPQSHNFDVVLNLDVAEQAIRVLLNARSQRENIFALAVHRYAPEAVPCFANKLNANLAPT